MKKSIPTTFIILLLFSLLVGAQNRPPQDVRRVIVTSKYEIMDGKRTGLSMVIKQEIKDSLDRIHTILNRDYTTQRVVSHTWHTFKGKQIVRTDEFRNEQLTHYKMFTYTPDSLIDTETIYRVSPGDTAFYVTLKYKYINRKPIQIDAFNLKGKQAYRVKMVYDNQGTEIKRTVKVKKGFSPLDSIVVLTNTLVYDSLGRVVKETSAIKYLNGSNLEKNFRYGYNAKGLKTSIEEVDKAGSIIYKTDMEYNDKGMLKFISVYNSQSVLIQFYAKKYELYPSRDRRNQIIEY